MLNLHILGAMLKGRNIICISSTEWRGNYIKATVELMKEMAVHNKLLFVNSPYTVKDVTSGLLNKKDTELRRSFGLKSRIEVLQLENGGTVYLLTPPPAFTINFLPEGALYRALLRFNCWQVLMVAKRALKKLEMEQNLINIVAFNQGMGVMTGRKYGEKTLIYHCYDEINGAHPWLKKHGVALENRLLKMVDGVIVTSRGLYEAKRKLTKACYIVKNAVKLDLFIKGFQPEVPTKKVVGYIGTVDERLDYDLLAHLLEEMPEVEFVFVGRITTEFHEEDVLKKYPNATFTGAKRPEELPQYLKTFSAGIIPFAKSDFTKGIYPMKINEYLATGLPVVSTNFSYLDDFEGVISIADDKYTFLKNLRTELNNDTPELKQIRLEVAQQNTWLVRAEELSDVIEKIEADQA